MTYTNATTLVEFLRARYDEIERLALLAADSKTYVGAVPVGMRWEYDELVPGFVIITGTDESLWCGDHPGRHARVMPEYCAQHVSLHDPAAVLADVEAKRRILDWLGHTLKNEMGWDGMDEYVLECLALPFADHPDYDPSWRPAEVGA